MDPDLVLRKAARAGVWLDDLERRVAADPGATNGDGADLVAFHLQLAVQECIDLAAHWVATERWPPPDNSASAFTMLAEKGMIPPDTAAFMRGAVGLRNRIAHGYASVDKFRLFAECQSGLPEIRRFLLACATACTTPG